MRALDLLFEKGLRIGQRELEQGAAIGDIFTFGFEAELGYRMQGYGEERHYQLEELQSIDDITDAIMLHPRDVQELKTRYEQWAAQAAEEVTNSRLDDDEISEEDWQEEYAETLENLSEKDWIEAEGVEDIILDLDARDVEWEISGGELTVEGSSDSDGNPTDSQFEEVLEDLYKTTGYQGTMHSKSYSTYSVTYDSSVETQDENDIKLEIVSPIFESLDEFEDNMIEIFRFIDRSGYTNDSTGFHVNIGFQDDSTEIDLLKLQLLVGDEYIGRMFGRQFNHYAQTVMSYIQQKVAAMRDDEYARLMDPKTRREQVEEWLSKHDKYRSINASKLETGGYLEFRVIGGENYHEKPREIMEVVSRYLYVLKIAADPQVGRREYLSKLGKLMAKTVNQGPVQERSETLTLMNLLDGQVDRREIEHYFRNRHRSLRALPLFIIDILEAGFSAEDILKKKPKLKKWLQKEMKTYEWTPEKIGEVLQQYPSTEVEEHRDDLEKLGFIPKNQTTS